MHQLELKTWLLHAALASHNPQFLALMSSPVWLPVLSQVEAGWYVYQLVSVNIIDIMYQAISVCEAYPAGPSVESL